MRKLRPAVVRMIPLAIGAVLAGCGGGNDGPNYVAESPFINFTNRVDGETVLDANNDAFRVTKQEGCLWSDQYQFVTNWCLTGSGTRLDFGSYFMVLASHPGSYGGCVTVLAEENSLYIIDIFLNRNGVLDFAFTDLQALPC